MAESKAAKSGSSNEKETLSEKLQIAVDDQDESFNKEHINKPISSWKDHIDEKWLTEDVARLSKNQQKKLLKKKVLHGRRMEKRKAERLRKKERRAQLREAGLPLPRRMRSKEMKNTDYCDLRIAIDLDFYDLMNPNDLRMILKQVKQCYADNRKVKNPFKFHVTSFCEKYKELFASLQPGYVSWQLSIHSENYMETFDNESIVYLTADSENVLETLDNNKVYIIGGLVDHNQQKGLCYELAKKKGIAHAQLPIGQYVKLNTRKVLTINHVFEILLQYKESLDWKDAFFKVIPKRKGLDELDDDDDDEKKKDQGMLPKQEKLDECDSDKETENKQSEKTI